MEINNESYGITAEKLICDIFNLDSKEISHRSVPELEKELKPIIEEACKQLPRIIRYVGAQRGNRGGQSKSTVDFLCKNNETVSIKTNRNSDKVCPSECGQPGQKTFDDYFGHLYEKPITPEKFKSLCLNHSDEMMPIYLDNLFDCYYLIWLYYGRKNGFEVVKKKDIMKKDWEKNKFSFSKDINNWNESCTVYYDGKTIGEYQVHNHRNCYKFRFNLKNLLDILK